MDSSVVLRAFGLTLFAGLATGVGSVIGFLSREFKPRFLAATLGFSAGVMIYVSLVEIFAKAKDSLTLAFGSRPGYLFTVLAFFSGMALIALIDKLIPSAENPHEPHNMKAEVPGGSVALAADAPAEVKKRKLMRMGIFSALAIGIHNFPEGLATFMAALADPALGISIAVAIAIHNIPEGLAVSSPIYYATGSKRKAFVLSFLSGFSEPVGALIGYFILLPFFSPAIFGLIFASVAGIMVYISLDELLPTAEEYGEHHVAIFGLIAGMAVMAVSLLLFA